MKKSKNSNDLQSLPSIGPSLAQDLRDLGFHTPYELLNQNPEEMYADLCELRKHSIDRCVLYSFRCAVYAVNSDDDNPELQKWWNWKNKKY